jgi:hypothetical protein
MKPEHSISYYVTATDSVGCSETGNPNLVHVTVFPLGIEDGLPNTNIKIYPNPATSYIEIEISSKNISNSEYFTLIDMHGKEVYSIQITSNKQQIDVSELASGNYSYIMGGFTGKIVIR